jgi:hypothetical protein
MDMNSEDGQGYGHYDTPIFEKERRGNDSATYGNQLLFNDFVCNGAITVENGQRTKNSELLLTVKDVNVTAQEHKCNVSTTGKTLFIIGILLH